MLSKHLFIVVLICALFSSCKKESKKPVVDTPSKTDVSLAFKNSAELGEGAIWNHQTQELFWVDIEGKTLHIFNPVTKVNRSLKTPSRIGTVVPMDNQKALIALEDGIYTIDILSGEIEMFSEMTEILAGSRLNDGKCDPSGRLWVGSMHLEYKKHAANLFMIDQSKTYEVKVDSVTISNGIVWTKNKKVMYYIDTPTSEIKAYDFDNATGTISNERIAVKIPKELGSPDGMTIDEEDMLWVGMWNGNAVIRFNPITGKMDRKLKVPAHNITSCAFGGPNLDTLYITSATVDMTPEEKVKYPLAGSVFKAVPRVKGVNSFFFM